jgi:hypothetical protein
VGRQLGWINSLHVKNAYFGHRETASGGVLVDADLYETVGGSADNAAELGWTGTGLHKPEI